jgi:hypothetical protein
MRLAPRSGRLSTVDRDVPHASLFGLRMLQLSLSSRRRARTAAGVVAMTGFDAWQTPPQPLPQPD